MTPQGTLWVVGACFVGLLMGWLMTWTSTKLILQHYQEDARYWYKQWRKADEQLTKLILSRSMFQEEEEEDVLRLPAIDRILDDTTN